MGGVLVLDVQEGEVAELIEGDDADFLVGLALQLAVLLIKDFDRDLRFAFDDVEIGDEEAVAIDEEARTQGPRGAHLDDGRAEGLDQFAHALIRRRRGARPVKALAGGGLGRVCACDAAAGAGPGTGAGATMGLAATSLSRKSFKTWSRGMTRMV